MPTVNLWAYENDHRTMSVSEKQMSRLRLLEEWKRMIVEYDLYPTVAVDIAYQRHRGYLRST